MNKLHFEIETNVRSDDFAGHAKISAVMLIVCKVGDHQGNRLSCDTSGAAIRLLIDGDGKLLRDLAYELDKAGFLN